MWVLRCERKIPGVKFPVVSEVARGTQKQLKKIRQGFTQDPKVRYEIVRGMSY